MNHSYATRYDQDGNLRRQVIGGKKVFSFAYDAENHLVGISGDDAATTVYDADGQRVKASFGNAPNVTTVVYVGSYFEQRTAGSTVSTVKTYFAGNLRVAMRTQTGTSDVLHWLLSDTLGSTTTAAGANGELVASAFYEAWGEITPVFGDLPTARRYTGQLQDPLIAGIYYYGARYYDPALGRFLQADTIVPSPENPQSLNRYSYVLNNPLRYVDPTGHAYCVDTDCTVTWHPIKQRYVISPGASNVRSVARSIVADLGGLDDLEAMAMITEVAAGAYRTWDRFMPEMGKIFTGSPAYGTFGLMAPALSSLTGLGEGGCAGIGREPHDCPGNKHFFQDTGFHLDFRDYHNQPYHVWAYIAQTTTPGDAINFELNFILSQWGNLIHEEVQSNFDWDRGWGTSWQDWVLSEAGVHIGYKITYGLIASPMELGDALRRDLGPQGPGSYGKLQWLESNYGSLRGSP